MDNFWGHSSTFWVGIEAIGVWAYTFLVVVTLWFIYRQVRLAAKTFQLDAIRRLQELVDDFREDRRILFTTCPLDLALSHLQFPKRPPGRHSAARLDTDQNRIMALTPKQVVALRSINYELRERAKGVIARLNDIGQLAEDGFIDRHVFLGKYHVMIIQCCHLVEAIRRDEEALRGGSYGQRLLRMREWATTYNDIWPKHRLAAIEITDGSSRRVIYHSPAPTVARLASWTVRRWLSWY
jgi:hypothetical protein